MPTTDNTSLTDVGDVAIHSVTGLYHGDPTSVCILTVMCRGKRFHITIFPENLQEHRPEYTLLISALKEEPRDHDDDDDDDDDDASFVDPPGRLEEWVLQPFVHVFPKLAPKLSSSPQRAIVTECFDPPTFFFSLECVDGVLSAVRTTGETHETQFWIPRMKIAQSLIRPELRVVRPHDLEVLWDPQTRDGPDTAEVMLLGTTERFFLKQAWHGSETGITREVETLLRLQDLGVTETIRIPRLHGYVQYEGDDRISGLLLTCIDARGTLDGVVLHHEPSEEPKTKWMEQIEVMLKTIHQAGVVWGDAKADNVLIDKQNDAWIIDFGGSYTPGWVDEDKMETVEGDLQGLLKIKNALGLVEAAGALDSLGSNLVLGSVYQ